MSFYTEIDVRWADVDMNHHVRHSAYYDYGAHTRMKYLEKLGFSGGKLMKAGVGPILFHEQCHFIREIRMSESIRVNLLRGWMKKDGSQWVLHHHIFKQSGEMAAHITAKGAWMDVYKRRVTAPPEEILFGFDKLPAGNDYVR